MALTTAERYELRRTCLEARQVISMILTGATLHDPIGFAKHMKRFVELAEKAAAIDEESERSLVMPE